MTIYYVRPDGDNGASGENNTADPSTGAWADPGYAAQNMSADDICYVLSGTYAMSTTTAGAGGPIAFPDTSNYYMEGFETTPGDLCPNANYPILDANGNAAANMVTLISASTTTHRIRAFEIDGDGVAGGIAGNHPNYTQTAYCVVHNCTGPGFSQTGCHYNIARDNGTHGFWLSYNDFCVADNNGTDGFHAGHAFSSLSFDNTANGFYHNTWGIWVNCSSVGNGSDGFECSATPGRSSLYVNCVAYGNASYGWNIDGRSQLYHCAGGGNTSGNLSATPDVNFNFVSLSGDPFVDSASDDYRPDPDDAEGAKLVGAGSGVPGQSAASLDIGALPHTASGGGGGGFVGSGLLHGPIG